MKATNFTATVASDLYQAGYSCDGHPFIAEQFYVVIENDAGRRFRHNAIFKGTQQVVCEETGDAYFPDMREEATEKAERLVARINAAIQVGVELNNACWFEVDPAYGSEEFISQGIDAKRAFEDCSSV